MRHAARLLAFLAALLCAVPALAGITTTQLGTGTGTVTAVITTGASTPTGSLIVVVVNVGTLGIAATSVVDSAVNCTTYTALDNAATASRPTLAVFYCANTGATLGAGATITVTVPATDVVTATAFAVTGMNTVPADVHAKQVNGASGTTATATSTGTLGSTYELVVGGIALTSTTSGFVPSFGFTSIGGTSGANGSVYTAYQVACTTASVTFTPSWTTSRAYMSDVVSFKFAAADTQCGGKANAYVPLQFGVAASENVSKTNAYAILQGAMGASKSNAYAVLSSTEEDASKTNSYVVLNADQEAASKTNAYAVLNANQEAASKTNAYAVLQNSMAASKTNGYVPLQFGAALAENTSKTNGYVVLQYASSMSKTNGYVVLKSANSNKLLFHAFP